MQKIRIAVIGAGRWGPNLLRNFDCSERSQVILVIDKVEARLKALIEKYPHLRTATDPGIAFSDPSIDAVIISTPTESHYALCCEALAAGKHVFVEKPLATKTSECLDLIRKAAKQNRTLFVGHVFIYNASVRAVKEFLDRGELGRIYYVQATRTNLGPIRTDVNALWDLSPHDISILNFWFGERPTAVSANGGRFVNPQIEDVVFATYYYPNGAIANLHTSWLNPQKLRQILVVGEKKMLLWDDMDLKNPIKIFDKHIDRPDPSEHLLIDSFGAFRTSIFEGETFMPKVEMNEPLKAECEAFLDAIANPASSASNGFHGLEVVEILEATTVSLEQNAVRIPIRYEKPYLH